MCRVFIFLVNVIDGNSADYFNRELNVQINVFDDFQELSWALYMMIIFAQDRILSNTFSFKSTLRS